MENNQNSIIRNLRSRIEQLISRYEAEKKRTGELAAEKLELTRNLEFREKEFSELKTKYEMLRLAKSFGGDSEASHDAKIKINKIVREIDHCIARLNK